MSSFSVAKMMNVLHRIDGDSETRYGPGGEVIMPEASASANDRALRVDVLEMPYRTLYRVGDFADRAPLPYAAKAAIAYGVGLPAAILSIPVGWLKDGCELVAWKLLGAMSGGEGAKLE